MRHIGILCALLLAGGCNLIGQGVPGSGVIKQEVREVVEFTKLSFAGGADIKVVSGAEQVSCTLQCDDNLLPYVSTEVVDDELQIRLNAPGHIMPTKGLQIEIAVPKFTAIDLAGGTTTSITGLDSASFDVKLAGSHDLACEGRADALMFKAAGSCKLEASKLQTKSASIEFAGSGTAGVQASEKLSVRIAGSGSVRYLGEPAITQSISGSGKIEKMEP